MGASIKNGQQPKPQGGLKALYCHQIFGMDSAAVTAQKLFSSHGGFPTYALRITKIKHETIYSNQYATTKQRKWLMTRSQLELRKSQVEPLWTIKSLDKNASRLALLCEMLQSFQKRTSLFLIGCCIDIRLPDLYKLHLSWNGSGI